MKNLIWKRVGLPGLALFLSACATVQPSLPPRAANGPLQVQVTGVPLIAQKDDYCGPAALAMVLTWGGLPSTQDEVATQVFSPGAEGAYRTDMLTSARRHGQLAVELERPSDLYLEVAAGHPVIVFQNLGVKWLPRWHYAVVTGYDLEKGEMTLHAGQDRPETMGLKIFERTWARGDRWAMVVLPPGELPAGDNPWGVLRGASALERVGDRQAALKVYRAGAQRWPDQWMWPFALGNVLYAEGDLEGAKSAFESALAIDPSVPEVQQNLSEVEKELK